MPVRVAFDATPLLGTRTGVGRFVEGLASGLASRPTIDLRAYGLTWRGRSSLAGAVPSGVEVQAVPMPASPLMRLWSRFDGPAAEWWTGRVDVVHGTNFVVPPARHAAEVVSVHDLTTVRFPELCTPASLRYPRLLRRAIARGATVVTPSAYIADEVVELLGADPAQVRAVLYGLTPAAPAGTGPGAAGPTGPPLIVALGTVEPRKDLPLLVRAFDVVAAGDAEVRLVVAGPDGWGADAFHAAVAGARHRDRVERLGWISEEQRADLMRRASVFAYPSVYEGFGFPPLEAMAAGVPVVASRAGSLPEVLADGAVLVDPGDLDGLAAALVSVLAGGPDVDDLIRRGRARAGAFSWDRMVDAFVDVYRTAAGGVPARRR